MRLRVGTPELDSLVVLQCSRRDDIIGWMAGGTQHDIWNETQREISSRVTLRKMEREREQVPQ
jgi:hypothetical protein